ncbi:response regulator [Rugamonas sp.]|uniref:response regulator n=1 Tax=Rugamonas sp. TaxID=1926287 RepID=UPI0025E32150|nr:response regulator [Rugamonas sp.]
MKIQDPDHGGDIGSAGGAGRAPRATLQELHAQIEAGVSAALLAVRSAPRVLHVDGDGDTALVLATLLVPETQVTHVRTLAAARRAIAHERYALVVLDPDLPDGDGAALIAALKQADSATPVLLYSAREPADRAQASAFLPKPWTSPRQLWRTVSQLLGMGGPAEA